MQNPKELINKYRTKTYILSVILVVIALGTAAISNFQDQYTAVTIVESIICILLLSSIPLALKQKYLETLGNIVVYLVGFTLLYNTTQIGGVDPGPYIGLIALIIISAFLTINKYSFIIYSITMDIGLIILASLNLTNMSTTVSVKYHVVYIILVIMVLMHKNYLDLQNKKLFALAEKTHDEAIIETKKAKQSATTAETYKQQKNLLEQQKKELEQKNIDLEKSQKELKTLNKLMTGRELKMRELKKENATLKKQSTQI